MQVQPRALPGVGDSGGAASMVSSLRRVSFCLPPSSFRFLLERSEGSAAGAGGTQLASGIVTGAGGVAMGAGGVVAMARGDPGEDDGAMAAAGEEHSWVAGSRTSEGQTKTQKSYNTEVWERQKMISFYSFGQNDIINDINKYIRKAPNDTANHLCEDYERAL